MLGHGHWVLRSGYYLALVCITREVRASSSPLSSGSVTYQLLKTPSFWGTISIWVWIYRTLHQGMVSAFLRVFTSLYQSIPLATLLMYLWISTNNQITCKIFGCDRQCKGGKKTCDYTGKKPLERQQTSDSKGDKERRGRSFQSTEIIHHPTSTFPQH